MAELLAPCDPLKLAYEDLMEGVHPCHILVAVPQANFSCTVPQDYVPRFV